MSRQRLIRVYFRDSNYKKRLLAKVKTEEDAFKVVNDFCKERNYICHYMRSWFDDEGRRWIDVGSWSEFFVFSTTDWRNYEKNA